MTPAQVAHIMSLVDYYGTVCASSDICEITPARAAVEAAQRDAPQQAAPSAEARKADDVDRLLHQVFLLCEAVEDLPEIDPKNEHERGFDKGRRFQAKQIRRAIGDWFQWTFCGSSFMGEPVLSAAPTEAKPAQDAVDAERYRFVIGHDDYGVCLWHTPPGHQVPGWFMVTTKELDAAISAKKVHP